MDTGAELSWVPAEVLESLGVERNNRWTFRQANGALLERWTGSVLVHVAGRRAADEVVFGRPGDTALFGPRSMEGLNLRVEPVTRRPVDAGPAPAAAVGEATFPAWPQAESPSRSRRPRHRVVERATRASRGR